VDRAPPAVATSRRPALRKPACPPNRTAAKLLDDPALAVDPGPRLETLLRQLGASALLVR